MERMLTLDEYEEVKRRAYAAGLDASRAAVLAYADDTQKHYGDLFGQCPREEYGDRCNITAALRVAAQRIDALRGGQPAEYNGYDPRAAENRP